MEYIQADECIEVISNFIRMRKKSFLKKIENIIAERNAFGNKSTVIVRERNEIQRVKRRKSFYKF